MAATPSTMLELGTPAPDFSLVDVRNGASVSLGDFRAKDALVVMFICHHCPFVQHVKQELANLGRDYASRGAALVAICSNDPAVSADDSPEGLKRMAAEWGLTYPVLFDESQAVAKAYQAACTPDLYVFDKARKLAYRGQLDDSRPSNGKPVTGADLRAAIDAVLAGRAVNPDQKSSIGCNIKWRKGNEPSYFATKGA
ncbi:MAG TPA: thioredoxin family protein [Bryobacteraceae bacterium]|nr:thioredoxin family protein [Bryobacteraceae bacterium]